MGIPSWQDVCVKAAEGIEVDATEVDLNIEALACPAVGALGLVEEESAGDTTKILGINLTLFGNLGKYQNP